MRVHRAHKKSRTGCGTCKGRRVKCDEERPVCRTCERRGTKCWYFDADVGATGSAPKSTAHSHDEAGSPKTPNNRLGTSRTSSPYPSCPDLLLNSRLMRSLDDPDPSRATLLAEYFQRASTGLIPGLCKEMRSVLYFNVIPALALHHEGVSHAVFALSTLSLALAGACSTSLVKSSSPIGGSGAGAGDLVNWYYARQANRFYDKSIAALKAYIADLSDENADAALACSILLVPYELAHSRLDRYHRHSSPVNSSGPRHSQDAVVDLSWMKFIRGLGSLMPTIQSRWPERKTSIFSFFQWLRRGDLLSSDPAGSTSSSTDNAIVSDHYLAPTIFAERPAAIARLRRVMQAMRSESSVYDNIHNVNETDTAVCIEALDQLDLVLQRFALCAKGQLPQAVFRVLCLWVVQIRDPFFKLLIDEHILALSVYAHFVVYLILFENLWWIGDMGRATLRNILDAARDRSGVFAHASFSPGQLLELFQWPDWIIRYPEIDD